MSPFSTAAAAAASSAKKLSSIRSMNGVRPGDEGDGTGVARESGEAVISGAGVSIGGRSWGDGMRTAFVSSSSVSPYGPLPTGALANSLVAMSAYGVSARRCDGSSGWVVAARKPPTGVVRRNVTVLSSSAAVSTSAHELESAARRVGVLERRDRVQDVGGGDGFAVLPHASSRMWKVQVLPSSDSLYE